MPTMTNEQVKQLGPAGAVLWRDTMPPITDEQVKSMPMYKHLTKLVGKKVTGVVYDPDADIFALKLTGRTDAWILCDPEGNGPGHLDIQESP